MVACLPFSYYVEKTEEAPKLYIKYFSDCANYFSEKVKKYVNDKADNKIALEQINGQDPFDYIQNFGKPYVALRNPHAQFSIVKSIIHSFPLFIIPYNASELKMEFKLTDNNQPKKESVILKLSDKILKEYEFYTALTNEYSLLSYLESIK